jgi:hypothetical protein
MVRLFCVLSLVLGVSRTARAEDSCATVMAQVCPASRGDLEPFACVRAHEAEISRACPGDADALLAKAREIGADCEGDVARLCKGVAPGGGRIVTCLRNNESQLSQACQGKFNEWRLARMELQSACSREIGSLCGTVPAGAGRVWTCLRAHEQELGSDCRSAVQKF